MLMMRRNSLALGTRLHAELCVHQRPVRCGAARRSAARWRPVRHRRWGLLRTLTPSWPTSSIFARTPSEPNLFCSRHAIGGLLYLRLPQHSYHLDKSWDKRNLKSVQTQTMASKDIQEAPQNQNDKCHGIDLNERSLKSEQTQSMALQNSKEAIPNQDDKSGLFS